jgi:hypothetical protein
VPPPPPRRAQVTWTIKDLRAGQDGRGVDRIGEVVRALQACEESPCFDVAPGTTDRFFRAYFWTPGERCMRRGVGGGGGGWPIIVMIRGVVEALV